MNKNDIFLKHQVNIAKKTLKMSDAGCMILGGMTKEEARKILIKAGYSANSIQKMEN
jgi:hypothetical protein